MMARHHPCGAGTRADVQGGNLRGQQGNIRRACRPRTHLLAPGVPTSDFRYQRALFYLLACQTSCYRYWGQGIWTDYGAELAHRACEAASPAT